MIAALVQKDMTLYFRNQFFALITGLSLVFYVGMYFFLPATVDEALPLAVYMEGTASDFTLGEGLEVVTFDTEEALIEAVDNNDYAAGLSLPAAALDAISRNEATTLNVYYAPGIEPELRDSINTLLAARMNGLLTTPDAGSSRTVEVLGRVAEEPIPLRDRVLPMLLLLILAVEIMGMATLIVEEIEHGTARALLTTPLGTPQFFTAKALMGIALAFVQVFIVIAITGSIATAPAIVIVTLLVGCLLVTGIGFLIAAVARDMMSVIAWGMLALVILVLPSMTIMFPAVASGWMDYIPTFYLVDTLHQALNFNAGWDDVSANLLTLLVVSVGTLAIGSMVLRRRFA